jgi:hypothetical protein
VCRATPSTLPHQTGEQLKKRRVKQKMSTKNNQTQTTPKNPQPKKPELTFKIEISKTIQVPKICRFTTNIGAENLEEAHRIATEKAAKLHDQDGDYYIVTGVNRA